MNDTVIASFTVMDDEIISFSYSFMTCFVVVVDAGNFIYLFIFVCLL